MKLLSSTFMVVAALLQVGCDDTGLPLTAASGTMTVAQAQALASGTVLTTFVSNIKPNAVPSFGGTPPARSSLYQEAVGPYARSAFDSCTTLLGYDGTDADADGIKVFTKASFNCSNISENGGMFSKLKGAIEVRDYDDSKPYAQGGYLFDYDLSYSTTNNTTHFFDVIYIGKYSYVNMGSSLVQDANFTYGVTGSEDHNGTITKIDFRYQNTHNATFTPTDMNAPFDAGTASFTGLWGYKGGYDVGNPATHYDLNFVLKVTSADLVYDTTCSKFYDSGSITFSDASNNTIKFEFACSSITTTVNGTTVARR